MILSFNPQFVPKILAGTKKQTIREDKTNRWKVGNCIHFATGVRTKNYKQFASGTVANIKCILIQYFELNSTHAANHVNNPYLIKHKNKSVRVWIGSKILTQDEITKLATDDGFDTTKDFFNWFDKDFEGKIIVWQYLIPSITNNL
jgi:uncharacterized protein YqfB (UPF0267 family)